MSEFAERLNAAQIDAARHVVAEGIDYRPTPPLSDAGKSVLVGGYFSLIERAVMAAIGEELRRQKEISAAVDEAVSEGE